MTTTDLTVPFGWTLQWPELLVILFIALLIFGKRLPDVARSLGRGINQFKQGLREMGDEADVDGDGPDPDARGKDKVKPLPPPQEPVARTTAEEREKQKDAAEA